VNGPDHFDGTIVRTLLRSHLHDLAVLLLRRHDKLALVWVVPARLLDVHVLARLHRENRGRRVPVVGRGDHDAVDTLVMVRGCVGTIGAHWNDEFLTRASPVLVAALDSSYC
jgi:hypothetical protein